MSISEIALFVSIKKATEVCEIVMRQPAIKAASSCKRYSRGELLGYEVHMETTVGLLIPMSEDLVEGLLG